MCCCCKSLSLDPFVQIRTAANRDVSSHSSTQPCLGQSPTCGSSTSGLSVLQTDATASCSTEESLGSLYSVARPRLKFALSVPHHLHTNSVFGNTPSGDR